MGAHDDDILDFDFVDPPEFPSPRATPPGSTPPEPPRRARARRRPPRLPGLPQTPLTRLVGLVAFAILLIVLLSVWVEGCAGDDKRSTYQGYVDAMAEVASDSSKIGDNVATLLTTPGLRQSDVETKLGGLLQLQLLNVDRAREIDPPGPAHPAHAHAIAALAMRARGLEGLLATFRTTKDAKSSTGPGLKLAAQGRRLEASDVVWDDLFRRGFDVTADARGVDATAPPSIFVDDADLLTAESLAAIWKRVHGASIGTAGAGLHGNSVAHVKVTPAGTQLSAEAETTVAVSPDLGFEVGVLNSGEEQEVHVEVTLTIPKQPTAIVKQGTIDVIERGETKSVLFTEFGDVPFGEGTTVQVSIKAVPGEKNVANNTAEYPVVFSLGP